MIRFPKTIDALEELYKSLKADISTQHWQITCTEEAKNKELSSMLRDNAMSMFIFRNYLFVGVMRYGTCYDLEHRQISYDAQDLKEKWDSFKWNEIEKLFLTIFDKSGNPLYKWTFVNPLVLPLEEQVFDMNNDFNNPDKRMSQYLWIPIIFNIDKVEGEEIKE